MCGVASMGGAGRKVTFGGDGTHPGPWPVERTGDRCTGLLGTERRVPPGTGWPIMDGAGRAAMWVGWGVSA